MPLPPLVIVVLLGALLLRASEPPRVVVAHEFLVGAPQAGTASQPSPAAPVRMPGMPGPPMSFDDLGRGLLSLAQDDQRRESLGQRFGPSIQRGAALRTEQERGRAARRQGAERLCAKTVLLLGHLRREQLSVLTDGAAGPAGDQAWAQLHERLKEEP